MNEDFSIYQLRLGYLNQIHDGVGERLINLNPAVLNNPAFRTAGWVPDAAAIKRCYSPPIPTGTSADISSEYFQRPRRPTRRALDDDEGGEGGGVGGGLVTGQSGSQDTIGAAGLHDHRKREKRRRREALEDDDSSDLSDDSDEDDKGPAQSIKFSKMPVRHRAASSPPTQASTLRPGFEGDGPEVLVTSPSRPPDSTFTRLRSGSMGQVESIKQRARRDTATSSDISSDNDVGGAPKKFKRKLPSRPGKGPSVLALEDDIEEEPHANSDLDDDDDIDVGEASDLSDEFEGTVESPSMLAFPKASDDMSRSPLKPPPDIMPAISASASSPKKSREPLPRLPRLPSGQRPLSMLPQPMSMISLALHGNGSGSADKPFQRFADLSGKGEASPLWIKIYAPFSDKPTKPIEVPLRRTKDDRPVTVAELIGLSLWRYAEEGYKPQLPQDECNINWWTLRIVDDEEIDLDFPALGRTRPAVDFTSNNNRPPQRRARDKPWDEFGLVKATTEQFKENEEITPQIGDMPPPARSTPRLEQQQSFTSAQARPEVQRSTTETSLSLRPVPSFNPRPNPITGPSFGPSALRREITHQPADLPQREERQGAAKTGAPRTVTITHMNPTTMASRVDKYETTTDSYIAEVFEQACSRLGLEKALYNLKVHGTQTVAPPDRTVEALNERLHLDLVPRRFHGPEGFLGGLSGSPGSSSPNAPLELTPANATPSHTKKKGKFTLHPLAAQQKSELNHTTSILNMQTEGKRYNVMRKQPLSFAATHPRTLIITPEYMTIMPAAPDSLAAPSGKVTNVPMTSVIGAKVSRKHTKMVRILVYRERETKRYDFEAANHREAEEIVDDVRRGMEVFGQGAFPDD